MYLKRVVAFLIKGSIAIFIIPIFPIGNLFYFMKYFARFCMSDVFHNNKK